MPPALQAGQILIGPAFNEPVRIETIRPEGNESWTIGVVGTRSEQFRRVTFTKEQLETLKILSATLSYRGDGQLLRLGVQAYALGVAYEFDPFFGLSISRVDPLPHQLEAVYEHLLKPARVRFLLADDAGAGKTIMSGLLLRELKLRGLVERVLIVCPANLAFQWQRELREKFDEKFVVLRGPDLREQFGVNQWLENRQIITSLDLAKRKDILPGLRQCRWELVIVDEAHRMSAASEDKKNLRYKLGEDLRDRTDHLLLLTATPHRGDPENFSLFLRLLDADAYADVKSIRQAMERRSAPFYLRRTKEAMVYFPERQPDGTWVARKIFTKRIPSTAEFRIDGAEYDLYCEVTRFVKRQSVKAMEMGDDARARAVTFLMALYQRRLASSTYAVRHSLENRAHRLQVNLKRAQELSRLAPTDLPTPEELEEMEDQERERLEEVLEAVTLAQNPEQVHEEVALLKELADKAKAIEATASQGIAAEAKLSKLKQLLQEQGFFDHPEKRLLIFTEFKDTLDYLVMRLKEWGFLVGFIHGGMRSGAREEPGSRLYAEQQFKDGADKGGIQVLVATEAAGEGINLQCCNILFNYDIPWNPNRLEQRMGRIHRYGQLKPCLIFNFVAANTIEGQVLHKLLEKLQEIRDALSDEGDEGDAVFNVVGDILPASYIERVLREYYAGKFGDADLEDRLLRNVNEESFRSICRSALEGLASKRLNLQMLIERRAQAQEHRVVPEAIARFMREAAELVPYTLKEVKSLPHCFDPGPTPQTLRSYDSVPGWKHAPLITRYPRLSTDRPTAEKNNLEWVTPGHGLFEALRRHMLHLGHDSLAQGACFYWLDQTEPVRLDFYRARVVDGLSNVIHERLFVVQLTEGKEPVLREPGVLSNLLPVRPPPELLPPVALAPEATAWLYEHALQPFLIEVGTDRQKEIARIGDHIELSLTELLSREDQKIGRLSDLAAKGVEGSAGNLQQAEDRHSQLLARRQRRRQELQQQQSLTLQAVERLTSVLVLPYPEADRPEVRQLRPDKETEEIAMRFAIQHEIAAGRAVADVHEKDLGYDITSLDSKSGELRLIEVKGIGAAEGTVFLTPHEHEVAEDRRDCYWLYVVTCCNTSAKLTAVKDPAARPWQPVQKVQHFTLTTTQLKGSENQ